MENSKKRTEEEYKYRQELIDKIEGYTGSLVSIIWSRVTTEDLIKLYTALNPNF